MTIKGILFDLYGTLIDIETDESLEEIYRAIAHYLTYHGIYLHRWEVRDRYYEIMKQQKEQRGEEYPEIEVEAIWNRFLRQEAMKAPLARRKLATILAQLYRAAAQAWQLTASNAIQRLADVPVAASSLSTTLPAQSITLFVIPRATAPPPPPLPTIMSRAMRSTRVLPEPSWVMASPMVRCC